MQPNGRQRRVLTDVTRLLVAALFGVGITIVGPSNPAGASQCVIPGGYVVTFNDANGMHAGCAKVEVVAILSYPGHYWINYWVQDTTDPTVPFDGACHDLYIGVGTDSYRFKGRDCDSVDWNPDSRYWLNAESRTGNMWATTAAVRLHGRPLYWIPVTRSTTP